MFHSFLFSEHCLIVFNCYRESFLQLVAIASKKHQQVTVFGATKESLMNNRKETKTMKTDFLPANRL